MSFQNPNVCNSFTLTANSATLVNLPAYQCSEVIVFNHASANNHLIVFDNPNLPTTTNQYGFCVDGKTSFTFRGVTNSNQLSCRFESGDSAHEISCRTQYFSQSIVRQ